MVHPYYDPGPPLRSPLDLLKQECPVCGARYWRGSKARDCCKGTTAHDAFFRRLHQQNIAAEARKRDEKGDTPRAGLGLKPCPNCHGKPTHWTCPLCDGSGQVPENMF